MDVLEPNRMEDILNFLSKNPNKRTEEEIRIVSKYFSEHYQYFIKLKQNKDFGFQRIEKITKFAKLETHLPDENIINYGELGDKFYILLEGSVALYKPIYYEEYLTPIEFSDLLIKIRDVESDYLKYERLIEKNNHLPFKVKEIEIMEGIKPNYMFYKVKIFLEKFEKIGEFGEGFSFGEMALIRKTTRNATIKTIQKSYLLTIEKKDYNNAIKELQDKKLTKDIEKFVGSYPIFKMLYKDKILEFLNIFNKKIIYKGDYLYQQNEESDSIYFLNKGTININFNISFSWLNEYLIYYNNYSGNLLFHLIDKKPKKYSDLIDVFQFSKKQMDSNYYLNKINNDEIKVEENVGYEKWEECNEKINEGNLIGIKYEEEQLNNSNKLFYLNLKDIHPHEMIGLIDAIECRKRMFSAQCISEHAELDYIRIIDLLKILGNLEDKYIYDFLSYILKRKDILKTQIINKLKYLEKKILFDLNNKYDNLKGDENNIKKEEDKSRIISVIKMKGFKTKIQELLDKDLILPSYTPLSLTVKGKGKKIKFNSTEKELFEKNKKDILTLKKIYKLSLSNPHTLKIKNKKELLKDSKYKLSNLYTNNKNIFPYSFSHRNKQIIEKTTSFLSNTKNNNLNSSNKDYIFNSYLSPSNNKRSKDKKFYTKIVPKFTLNKNIYKGKKISLTNKILSIYTSSIKDPSSTFTDSVDNNKIFPISFSDIKNKNAHHNVYHLTKISKHNKMKLLNNSKEKNNDDNKIIMVDIKDNNNKTTSNDEKIFYEKLKNNTKEFILGEKFNKNLRYELNKIKPWQYRTFYKK